MDILIILTINITIALRPVISARPRIRNQREELCCIRLKAHSRSQRFSHRLMRLALVTYHIASVDHQSRLTSICNISFNLLNSSTLMDIFQNLLVYTFNAWDNQMATRILH